MSKRSAIFLCDLTGNMARPWAEAGYECWCIDIQHSIRRDRTVRVGDGAIHFVWGDARSYCPPQRGRRRPALHGGVPAVSTPHMHCRSRLQEEGRVDACGRGADIRFVHDRVHVLWRAVYGGESGGQPTQHASERTRLHVPSMGVCRIPSRSGGGKHEQEHRPVGRRRIRDASEEAGSRAASPRLLDGASERRPRERAERNPNGIRARRVHRKPR